MWPSNRASGTTCGTFIRDLSRPFTGGASRLWYAYPSEIAADGYPVTAVAQAFDTTITSAPGDFWLTALSRTRRRRRSPSTPARPAPST